MSKKILVLEDEKDIGRIYAKFLKEHGYETTHVTDGLEGLKHIKENKPDLILLDLGMPNMNGIEFYQFICDNHGKPRYPVLVLTGRTDLEALFRDFQVEGFIIKPFKQSRLLEEVDIVFNKQEQKQKLEHAKKIMVIDNNAVSAGNISKVLDEAGYRTEIAHSGTIGIEKVMEQRPDMVVVSLQLDDLSGDLVILRLQNMAKTQYIKYILYVPENYSLDKVVMEQFGLKSGVKVMCEYAQPKEILEAVHKVFEEVRQGI